MHIAIRQFNRTIAILPTSSTRELTDEDIREATLTADESNKVKGGYYDVALTQYPLNSFRDVDMSIEIK